MFNILYRELKESKEENKKMNAELKEDYKESKEEYKKMNSEIKKLDEKLFRSLILLETVMVLLIPNEVRESIFLLIKTILKQFVIINKTS